MANKIFNIIGGVTRMCMLILLFPIRMASAGFKTVGEYGEVKKKLNLKKGRVLFFKSNRMFDKMLDIKDDIFAADIFEQQMFFKGKNTYLDEKGNNLMVVTDGNPESNDLSKCKCDKETQLSTAKIRYNTDRLAISMNDGTKEVELPIDDLKKRGEVEIPFRKTIYTPIDVHQHDSDEKKEVSVLVMKVWSSKVIQVIQSAAGGELMAATAMGIAIGFILAMTIAYYLK